MTLEDKPSRLVDVQYSIRKEQKNSSRKKEVAGPKQKQCSGVDVSGGIKVKSYAVKNNTA